MLFRLRRLSRHGGGCGLSSTEGLQASLYLIQSPATQSCRQRVIMEPAPTSVQCEGTIELRNIAQACPQAQMSLEFLPKRLVSKYTKGTLLHEIKPLYRIAEAWVQ